MSQTPSQLAQIHSDSGESKSSGDESQSNKLEKHHAESEKKLKNKIKKDDSVLVEKPRAQSYSQRLSMLKSKSGSQGNLNQLLEDENGILRKQVTQFQIKVYDSDKLLDKQVMEKDQIKKTLYDTQQRLSLLQTQNQNFLKVDNKSFKTDNNEFQQLYQEIEKLKNINELQNKQISEMVKNNDEQQEELIIISKEDKLQEQKITTYINSINNQLEMKVNELIYLQKNDLSQQYIEENQLLKNQIEQFKTQLLLHTTHVNKQESIQSFVSPQQIAINQIEAQKDFVQLNFLDNQIQQNQIDKPEKKQEAKNMEEDNLLDELQQQYDITQREFKQKQDQIQELQNQIKTNKQQAQNQIVSFVELHVEENNLLKNQIKEQKSCFNLQSIKFNSIKQDLDQKLLLDNFKIHELENLIFTLNIDLQNQIINQKQQVTDKQTLQELEIKIIRYEKLSAKMEEINIKDKHELQTKLDDLENQVIILKQNDMQEQNSAYVMKLQEEIATSNSQLLMLQTEVDIFKRNIQTQTRRHTINQEDLFNQIQQIQINKPLKNKKVKNEDMINSLKVLQAQYDTTKIDYSQKYDLIQLQQEKIKINEQSIQENFRIDFIDLIGLIKNLTFEILKVRENVDKVNMDSILILDKTQSFKLFQNLTSLQLHSEIKNLKNINVDQTKQIKDMQEFTDHQTEEITMKENQLQEQEIIQFKIIKKQLEDNDVSELALKQENDSASLEQDEQSSLKLNTTKKNSNNQVNKFKELEDSNKTQTHQNQLHNNFKQELSSKERSISCSPQVNNICVKQILVPKEIQNSQKLQKQPHKNYISTTPKYDNRTQINDSNSGQHDQLYIDCLKQSKNMLKKHSNPQDQLNETLDYKKIQQSLSTSPIKHAQRSNFFSSSLIHEGLSNNTKICQSSIRNKNYEGDTFGHVRHGKGIQVYIEQQLIYKGDWKFDLRNGYGVLTSMEGNIIYQGQWESDKFSGYGTLINVKSNDEAIQDKFGFNFWLSYKGEFKNDVFEGKGILQLFNGNKYEGLLYNGSPDGWGKYTCNNGEQITGQWQSGQLIVTR